MNNKPQNFGDFVRGQLANPASLLSTRVIFFRRFIQDKKDYPNLYDFEWFQGLPIYKSLTIGARDKRFYIDCWYPCKNKWEVADFRT